MIYTISSFVTNHISEFLFHLLPNFISPIIIVKIIIRDWKPSLKDALFILLASLAATPFIIIPNLLTVAEVPYHSTFRFYSIAISALLASIFPFIYLYKLKSRPAKEAVILAVFSILIRFSAFFFANTAFQLLFGMSHTFYAPHAFLFVLSALSALILSAFLAYLFGKATATFRKKVNNNPRLQTAFMIGSIVGWVSSETVVLLLLVTADNTLSLWVFLLLLGYIGATVAIFFFYSRSLNSKLIILRKEAELTIQQQYTDRIEKQQTAIRKFKHDYQNILLSIDAFVMAEDLDGLKRYMPKIRTASTVITEGALTLENLNKIKPLEIKILLAEKIMLAQDIGANVSITFEVLGEIDHIPGDSVVVVRMLGIILDNSIEALTELQNGKLLIACYKTGKSVVFIVQNTCSPDIPPYSQLKQEGFSTKSDGRGLGLSNLSELAGTNPNITLQSSIKRCGNFIQKLSIRDTSC